MQLPPTTRRSTARLVPFLPAAGAFLYLFRRVLFDGEVFSAGDHAAYYWPVGSLFAALVGSSRGVPLWNPFLAAGQPFAANPHHAVFHPLSALLLVAPFEWAFRLQVLVPALVLALAGYFLGRTLGQSRATAACSAVAWGAGGATVSLLQVLPSLFTLAPLPFALGFSVRIGRRRSASDVFGFALIFGLMVLGGDPPSLLMAALLCAVAALHGSHLGGDAAGPAESPVRVLGRLALGGALGAVIGAATLVPGLAHAVKTVRARGLDAPMALSFTTPVARLAELAVPDVFDCGTRSGDPVPLGERLYPERGRPFLRSIYPGLLVLVGTGVAWASRRGPARLWAVPGALGVLLALGAATPVFPALRWLPGLSGIRFPERFLLMTLASVSVAGTCGLGSLIDGGTALRRAALAGGVALLASAGLAATVGGELTAAFLAPRYARQAVLLAAALATLGVAARARRGSLLRLLPAVLLAAELAAAARPHVGSQPVAAMRAVPAPLAPLLRAPLHGYVFHAASQDPLRGRIPGIASPPYLAQFAVPSALDKDFDLAELSWSTAATASILRAVSTLPEQADAILARRGIAAIVAFRPDAPRTLSAAASRPPAELLSLLAVPRPQPLAFAAEKLVAASGADAWRRALAAAGPAARGLAIVDPGDVPWEVPASVSPGEVRVVSRRATRIRLLVDARGPDATFVALNQTWDPGWRARRNGEPLPVVRTDLSLSGFLVPPGRHEIELSYENDTVFVGLGVSLLGLLATGLAYRATRRPLRPPATSRAPQGPGDG